LLGCYGWLRDPSPPDSILQHVYSYIHPVPRGRWAWACINLSATPNDCRHRRGWCEWLNDMAPWSRTAPILGVFGYSQCSTVRGFQSSRRPRRLKTSRLPAQNVHAGSRSSGTEGRSSRMHEFFLQIRVRLVYCPGHNTSHLRYFKGGIVRSQ
jgi:hypothetical protein